MAWQTDGSRTVYENRWIRVREDAVRGPHGAGIYGVVEVRSDAVFIVALDEHDRVLLVELDRYATGRRSIEVPAGGSDGDAPLLAAQRELLEETGYAADSWELVGGMDALNGIAHAPEHVFLARELRRASDAAATQQEEGIAAVRAVPFAEVLRMIAEGVIRDGETIAALALVGVRLGRFA